jgi:hypothetical protein
MTMACEAARICCALVGNRGTRVGSHDIRVKIHHSFAGDRASLPAHTVCGMAGRAREPIIDVASVLAEAGIREN